MRRRHLATAAVALALVEGARVATGAELRLKWPNDIIGSDPVQGEAKVAGILAESPDGAALVVGAGMNVSWAPEGMGATCLDGAGPGGRAGGPGRSAGGVAAGAGPPLRPAGTWSAACTASPAPLSAGR